MTLEPRLAVTLPYLHNIEKLPDSDLCCYSSANQWREATCSVKQTSVMRVLCLEPKDCTFDDVVNYMLHVREASSS